MDTTKCTALLTILEKGSLSAAADALGYTPSGISRMIDSMEEETGFALLTRSRRGVALTPEGEDMLPLIRDLARTGELYEQNAHRILGLDCVLCVLSVAGRADRGISRTVSGDQRRYQGIAVRAAGARARGGGARCGVHEPARG